MTLNECMIENALLFDLDEHTRDRFGELHVIMLHDSECVFWVVGIVMECEQIKFFTPKEPPLIVSCAHATELGALASLLVGAHLAYALWPV